LIIATFASELNLAFIGQPAHDLQNFFLLCFYF
jgi:hypothetical protein